MLESLIRPNFDRLCVLPSIRILAKFNRVSPNVVTYLSGLLGVMVVPCLALGQVVLAVFFLLCSGYCDTLDGGLARYLGVSSSKGAMLDICMDRLVESAVVLGLFLVVPGRGLLCLLMLISILLCVSSFLVSAIITEKDGDKSFHYSPGLMERAEAFIFFIAMMLLPAWFTPLAIAFCVLVFYTALLRIYQT